MPSTNNALENKGFSILHFPSGLSWADLAFFFWLGLVDKSPGLLSRLESLEELKEERRAPSFLC